MLFTNRRVQVTALTLRHAVATIFTERQFVDIGGLMSYTSSRSEQYQQVGLYVERILNGQQPSELPVMQPTLSSLLTSKPRERSESKFHRGCSRRPTR
jgi:putative tryptophan/tyrosine transport system substrate-binding protein